MAFPKYRPKSNLEELADSGYDIIRMIEGNENKGLLKDKFYKNEIYKYQKLFDYLDKGYKKSKQRHEKNQSLRAYTELQELNQSNLFGDYVIIMIHGQLYTEYNTIKMHYELKYPVEAKTEEEFYEKYFQKLSNLWKNIPAIKPNKKDIEMMNNFNSITRAIGKEKFEAYKEDLRFNSEKDEWEYHHSRHSIFSLDV